MKQAIMLMCSGGIDKFDYRLLPTRTNVSPNERALWEITPKFIECLIIPILSILLDFRDPVGCAVDVQLTGSPSPVSILITRIHSGVSRSFNPPRHALPAFTTFIVGVRPPRVPLSVTLFSSRLSVLGYRQLITS